jgi:hypothetical protein
MNDPDVSRQLDIFEYMERKKVEHEPPKAFISEVEKFLARLCNRCHGKGYEDLQACHGMGSSRHMYVTCGKCKGTGNKS